MRRRQTKYVSNRTRRNYNRNQNTLVYQSVLKLGPVSSAIIIGMIIMLFGLIYLVQASKTTSFDYKIDEIDQQISQLSIKKADLEIEKARLKSLASINQSQVAANLTNQTEATYINN